MSTEDSSYQGWKNYETWAVGLYLDGNYTGEGTYREVLELARYRVGHPFALADDLREFVETDLGEFDGLASDLLGAAMGSVDWHELAEHKLSEIAEEQGDV